MLTLTEIMSGLLAKAAARFGPHAGAGLFADFEQRKEHLHQETRVDSRGRVRQQWVSNAPKAPKKGKQPADDVRPALPQAKGNMPALFLPTPPPKKAKTPRAAKPKPAPESPLFNFDFGAAKPAPTPTVLAPRPAADGSLTMTQEEYRAQQAGALMVGSTKQENGKTYRLNGNHRWELVEGEPAAAQTAPAAATTSARPQTVQVNGEHLPLVQENDKGQLSVEGLRGSRVSQTPDGEWQMKLPGSAAPVHMTDNGDGSISVTKRAPAPVAPTPDAAPAAAPQPAAPARPTVDYSRPFLAVARDLPRFGFEMLAKATKARRLAANQEAIALSARLADEGRAPTPEERATLAAYTGDGGTNGDLNAHYTPTVLAGAMWRLLHRAGVQEGDVLEPSMGAGVFMETAPAGVSMTGVELSPVTQRVSKLLHQAADVQEPQPFERYHVDNPERQFAGSISNPPYGSRYQVLSDLDKPEIKQAERYFMDTILDKLEDGGVSVSLTNPGPFESEEGREFRARLLARADILGVYQLPQSTFKESESGVPPVVLVMKKRPHAVGMALSRLVDKHGEEALTHAGADDAAFLEGTRHLQPDNLLGEFTGKTLYRGYKDIQGDLTPELLSKMTEAPLSVPRAVTQGTLDSLGEHYGMDSVNSARAYAAAYGVPKEGEIRGGLIFHNHRWHSLNDAAPEVSDAQGVSQVLKTFADVRNNGQTEDAEMVRQDAVKRVEEYLSRHGNPHDHKTLRDAARHNHLLANLLSAVTKGGELARHMTTPLRDEDTGADQVDRADLHAVATHLHGKGKLTPEHVAQMWEGAQGSAEAATSGMLAHPELAYTEDGRFVPASAYYHGNVHERAASLDAQVGQTDNLAAQHKYQQQAARFRDMLPRKALEDFEVKPREKWLPLETIEDFINTVVAPGADATVRQQGGVFYVDAPDTEDIKEFRKYLNHAITPKAVQGQLSMSRAEIAAAKAAALNAAQERVKHLEASFGAWLSSSGHRDAVEDAYNAAFNSYVPETLSAEPLPAEEEGGWTGPKLHAFQRQDVRFMLQQGGGITALDVGLGKTHTGVALVAELQSQGRAKKPMVVVPRSLLPNWRQSFAKDHADATIISKVSDDAQHGKRILVIGQSFAGMRKDPATGEMKEHWTDDSGDVVAQKLVRAAHEQWHAVVITRDWHSRIPLRAETWQKMVETDIQKQRSIELDEADEDAYAGAARKKTKGKSVREREEEKAAALVKAARKLFKDQANPLNWEDLGVDAMICDEAHAYKNLYAAPPTMGGKSPKFMGAGGESKRAQDFNYKARQLRERNGGHGVYFLTATPTKNSPLEVFNMLSHITDAFTRRGVGLTEDFVSRYCNIEPRAVPQLDGSFEMAPCVIGFKNLGELRGLMSQYVFRRTKDSEDVKALPGWHVPERDDIDDEFEMAPDVAAQYATLARQAREASQNLGGFDESGRHVFSYLADMRKMTLDPALLGLGDGHNPRFQRAAEIAKQAADEGGKTVMFMDLGKQRGEGEDGEEGDPRSDDEIRDAAAEYGLRGTEGMAAGVLRKKVTAHEQAMETNAYDRLVEHLMKQGIPREQIAVVTGETAKSAQKRLEIKEAFNAGKLSVVIGSTPVIGEGFSLQHGTSDMVHLDTPWDPGTYQQRLGRAQRQGNKLASVRNHVLLAKNSFDAVTYSTMTGKQGWMQHLWDGTEDAVDNTEASSNNLDEIAGMLEGDPTKYKEEAAQRKAQLAERQEVAARQLVVEDVRRLSRQVNAVHMNEVEYKRMERGIASIEKDLPSAPASKVDEIREGLARKRGQLVKLAARKDKIRVQMESARKRVLENPRLTPEHRALVESGRAYLLDEQGGYYVKGGSFRDGAGTLRRVVGIDAKALQVAHAPMLPTSEEHAWSNKPRIETPADIAGATGHAVTRDSETMRGVFRGLLKGGQLGNLKRLHPDLATAHQDVLRETLAEQPELHTPYGGLWSVDEQGEARYTPRPPGQQQATLPAGHRLLLPTHDDHERLSRGFKRPDMNSYQATSDAPAQSTMQADYSTGRTTYYHAVTPAQGYTGGHIVKAEQPATGSLVELYVSMQASMLADKVQA